MQLGDGSPFKNFVLSVRSRRISERRANAMKRRRKLDVAPAAQEMLMKWIESVGDWYETYWEEWMKIDEENTHKEENDGGAVEAEKQEPVEQLGEQ